MAVTLDTIKNLSPRYKALIIGGVCLLLAYFYYFFFLQAALANMQTMGEKHAELKQEVEEKERIAAQKDKYVKELNTLNENLKLALTKLPDKKEIPGLLYSVATSGRTAGVDFILFEPKAVEQAQAPAPPPKPAKGKKDGKKAPVEEKFYDEIPVNVVVNGGFHNTAVFFGKVGNLPRIVNIENIAMEEARDAKGRGRILKTSCIIKTYMFVEKTDDKKKADEKTK
ncbi:MAG: type 4a pilus biogenesis protein PilO [Deltaproteobacteria bacterium]|nr:type 4a pilus biogenesis protein PilO [Deltaproteobacteria bacterium]